MLNRVALNTPHTVQACHLPAQYGFDKLLSLSAKKPLNLVGLLAKKTIKLAFIALFTTYLSSAELSINLKATLRITILEMPRLRIEPRAAGCEAQMYYAPPRLTPGFPHVWDLSI